MMNVELCDEPSCKLVDISNTGSTRHAARGKPTKRKLVVTSSGFHGAAKQELVRLVESIGALYSGDLVQGSTTHLVCKRLIDGFGTPKYQRALEWGVNIVSYDWLLASSAAGHPVQEQDYTDDQPQAFKPSPKVKKQLPPPTAPPLKAVACSLVEACPGVKQSPAAAPAAASRAAATPGVAVDSAAVAEQHDQQQPLNGLHQPYSPSSPSLALQQDQQKVAQHEEEPFSFNVSQYSSELLRHKQQQQQSVVQDPFGWQSPEPAKGSSFPSLAAVVTAAGGDTTDAAAGCDDADADADAAGGFRFAGGASSQQASPCVQHFMPLQQQQQLTPGEQDKQHDSNAAMFLQDASEIQPEGLADIPPAAATTAATTLDQHQQQEVQEDQEEEESNMSTCCSEPSSPASSSNFQASPTAKAGTPAGLGSCSSPTAPHTCSSIISRGSSPGGLFIPETQADLEDVWGVGAAGPLVSTPESLHYYASQQRSRTRVEAVSEQHEAVNAAAAVAAVEGGHGLAGSSCDGNEGFDSTTCSPAAGLTAAAETAGALAAAGAACDQVCAITEADMQQQQQQQGQDQQGRIQEMGTSSCSSICTSNAHQQLQQQDFRLTSESGRSRGSASTGLTRLRRRDGYRRQAGRVLVSELPDPSELELQDSDCELQDELEDSSCEFEAEAPAAAVVAAGGHCREGDAVRGNARPAPHSPVHSCSASSLPAQSCNSSHRAAAGTGGAAAAAVAAGDGDAASVISVAGRQASATTGTPSASLLTGSDGGLPVMKLNFSLGTSTTPGGSSQSLQQSHSQSLAFSAGTPSAQCTYASSDYSPAGSSTCTSSSRAMADSAGGGGGSVSSGGGNKDPVGLGSSDMQCSAAAQQQQQQQQHVTDGELPAGAKLPLSDGSKFVTKRRGAKQAATAAQSHCSKEQQQQQQQQPGNAPAAAEVIVKQEPEEWPLHEVQQQQACSWDQMQLQQQQQYAAADDDRQRHTGVAAPDAAEALLQNLRKQQRQQQQRQPEPKHQHCQEPLVKQERLDPAELLLQDLKKRQQHKMNQHMAGQQAAEYVDGIDCDDSQRPQQQQQQQQHRPPRHSTASSFATGMSTVSRKVPLRIVGGGQTLGPDTSSSSGGGCDPLEQLLQVALAGNAAAAAAAAAGASEASPAAVAAAGFAGCGGVEVKREEGGVDWLHTPEEQQQQQQRVARQRAEQKLHGAAGVDGEGTEDEDGFEITELTTVAVAARGKQMKKHLGAHLAHLSQAGGCEQVIPLKLLAKAPRGSTAKAFHGLKSSTKLVYADQVQVPWAHATFSTKERSRCVIIAEPAAAAAAAAATADAAGDANALGDDASSSTAGAAGKQQHGQRVFLAEPVAFYKLESGAWWVELLRFYSAKDLRELAKTSGTKLTLPPDFQLSYELLRGMTHEHVAMTAVQGEFKLSKVKKVPASRRSRPNPFFWRYSIDTTSCTVLTDRPVTDFLVQ